MPLRRKKFVLAIQPYEAIPAYGMWSPERKHSLSFCVALILLVGLVYPSMNPDVWREKVRIGLLKVSYGWQTTPLLTVKQASSIHLQMFSNAPKNGCSNALERDWAVVCPMISSQMSNNLDCKNANPKSKADILKNFEQSKTTAQYACLYGV